MRIVFPIAFGLAIVVGSVLCFYCWRIQRARKNLSSIQVSAIPDENLHVSKFLNGSYSDNTWFEVLQVHAHQIVNFNSISHSVVVAPLLNWQGRDKVGDEKNAVSTLPTLKPSELQHFKEQAQ